MVVYKILNNINGKVYIGQTVQDPPSVRFIKHKSDAVRGRSTCPIHLAIKHHGKENFSFYILQYANCKIELNELEISYIKYYRSNEKEYGYNLTEGGNTFSENFLSKLGNRKGAKLTLEHRNILSQTVRRNNRKPLSEEQKRYISETLKAKYKIGERIPNTPKLSGKDHGMYGKSHSEETKEKIRQNRPKELSEAYLESRKELSKRYALEGNPFFKEFDENKMIDLLITKEPISNICHFLNISRSTIYKRIQDRYNKSLTDFRKELQYATNDHEIKYP